MNVNNEVLSSKVEISLSCRNLHDMDILSKSDPMGVLFQKIDNLYCEIGRTEVIKNNLNPVFSKVFLIDYHFEERQLFQIEIYDCDSSSDRLTDHDFLGRLEFSLGELVSRSRMETHLTGGSINYGSPQIIILLCQEISDCKESLILQFNASKVDKKDFFGKSDPVLELYRSNDSIPFSPDIYQISNNFSLAYRSKPIMNTLNPSWPSFNIKTYRLCFGDKDRLIKIVCTDWNYDGSVDFIGECFTSINHLQNNLGKIDAFELINSKKKSKKKNYKNSGTMTLNRAVIYTEYSFLDYITGETELNFTVAIDFTASNGQQNDPMSLHFIPFYNNPGMENQYERAIMSVGSIIQDYDSNKMFPALGFGAKIPPYQDVSHCFPINFCPENPFCVGVEGLLTTYRSAIQTVKLYGPTNFAPSIRHVQQFAQQYKDGSKYFVLLIITDGVITDLDATIDAIIDCSFLPMSIIIIGVGNDDFSTMDTLDCDKGRLRHGQKVADRDIVQFVPIRDFMVGPNRTINQKALSKAVLFELPDQVTSWMKYNSISPRSASKRSAPPVISTDMSKGPPPYPGTGPIQAPSYPGAGPTQAPSCPTGGPPQAPYPMGGPPRAPSYQKGGAPQAPSYPTGGAPQAPYPGAGPTQAPYPGSTQPPSYPTGGAPQAPSYPGSGPPQAPYPMGRPPRDPSYQTAGAPQAPSYPSMNQSQTNP